LKRKAVIWDKQAVVLQQALPQGLRRLVLRGAETAQLVAAVVVGCGGCGLPRGATPGEDLLTPDQSQVSC
jgi:hypothetical protein